MFYIVIPARLASTRLPNKPLADIHGKPMIVRVCERAKLTGAKDIIVATDDDSIVLACKKHGFNAMMTAKTHPSGTDRIAEVAQKMAWDKEAVIVNVQGDEPLIEPELIIETAKRVSKETPMATACHPISSIEDLFNPNVVKVVLDKMGKALYFSRAPIAWHRQTFASKPVDIPPNYEAFRHVGLYAYRNDFLQLYTSLSMSPLEQIEALEQLRVLWHGYAISVYMSQKVPLAGVDTLEDLERVRKYFLDSGT